MREGIEVIERNARAQARLVEDVLEVSRIICGKVRLRIGPVDLSAVIDAALASARPAATAKGISLRRVVDAVPAPVQGDADRLQQVVWNLLSNAVKFTPAGGTVTVHASRLDTQATIEVIDTGLGIKADFLPFVFDRFRQFDGSITRSHGGLGLGLSITRHLVEMHGGHISASSEGDGKGAAFLVLLPLSTAAGSAPETGSLSARSDRAEGWTAAELPSLDACKVLVVDDEPDSRRVVVRLLTRAQAQVREAGSVAAALEVLEGWTPDVLISDIAMPGEDGYSLLRRLRGSSKADLRELPALALTAFVRPEDQAQALAAGFQNHLPKPFEPAALLHAVSSLAASPHETAAATR